MRYSYQKYLEKIFFPISQEKLEIQIRKNENKILLNLYFIMIEKGEIGYKMPTSALFPICDMYCEPSFKNLDVLQLKISDRLVFLLSIRKVF